ncbi:MAG: SGNH/GDSL hydrolase family protein [Psychroflexus halocasei]|uniref:SGNH/GDSL hydrolase family protein n=1 Tax=Psychroflexus sp. S27 TaxID=1982757 RepID=UPI000C2B3137|nr:SGNH/GDSL hydrolase family protein [Psychroflexus sp. S27]
MHFKFAFLLYLTIQISMAQPQISYLALGDSYTIGESVPLEKSWPHLLMKDSQEHDFNIKNPKTIAKTGWRTDELISAIASENIADASYDLVSLLIGVNNQYQSIALEVYKEEFQELLNKAIHFSKHKTKGVFVVSIPDYSTTTFAKKSDKKNIREELNQYNAYAKQLCELYEIPFYDVTDLSSEINSEKEMLAEDDLHPSAKQYQKWVNHFIENFNKDFSHLKHE